MFKTLKTFYQWVLSKSKSPKAIWWLSAVSFSESIFFPIPPDLMLIPMVLANRSQWLKTATVCTIASVGGGIVGYVIGVQFYHLIGQPILAFYSHENAIIEYQKLFNQYGFWLVMLGGFTPIPYKMTTVASGVLGFSFLPFVAASFVSRGARYFLLAFLLWKFGPLLSQWIDRYFNLLTLAVFIIAIAGFLLLKLI